LRASHRSETLSTAIHRCSYTQTQRPYSARAIRIKACSKDRTKRRPRCARALRCLENQTCSCARTRTLRKLAIACKSVHLACFTSVCDAQQLYTDAAIHRRCARIARPFSARSAPVQRPYSARTAPVLSASRRVAKTARSGVLGVHGHCVVSRSKPAVHVHTNLAQACESVFTLRASVGLRRSDAAIHVHTAAAPVLSASRRVTKTAGSGVLDVHAGIVLYRTLNKTYARTRTLLKLARAFTLRASRPSETPSSYTQMQLYTDAAPVQRPYSARAIRIKACSKDRTKRRPR
jgi:hypothetical protein